MLTYQVVQHREPGKKWLLMLHGIGGSSAIWYKQVPELAKNYNLLLPDLYGHGKTRETLPRYTFEGLSDDLVTLLDHMKIDKAHVAGISLGSILACFTGVYHPSRVESLILGGAARGMDYRTKSLLYSGHYLKHLVPYMWLYSFFARIIMPRPSQSKGRKIFCREAKKLGGKEFRKWYRLMMQFPVYMEEFENDAMADIPKLFISGSHDYLLVDQIRAWARRDPNAVLHIIENCGHVCNIQAPAEFNRVCLEYLESDCGCNFNAETATFCRPMKEGCAQDLRLAAG